MSRKDKFVDDGIGLEFLDEDGSPITVTWLKKGDKGHVSDDDDEEEGDMEKVAQPDQDHQSLTEEEATAYHLLNPDRVELEDAHRRLGRTLERVLRRQGAGVVAAVRARLDALQGVSKADEPDTSTSVVSLELAQWEAEIIEAGLGGLGSWDLVIDSVGDVLEDVAEDAVMQSVAVIGVPIADDLVNQVSQTSVRMARERAAEMVGRRVMADGSIVANPDARWAISDSTRTMVHDRIVEVIAKNEGSDALIKSLEEDHAFSPARAQMIARTEIADINSAAQMETYHTAASVGVNVKKRLVLGHKPCSVCVANASEGAIPLDQSFSSGDMHTPAHPHCVCATIPEVED